MVLNFQDKSLYATIFMNELSFGFDVDSHLRDKLHDEAKKNGLVSSYYESQIEDEISEESHLEGNSSKVYESKINNFLGPNIN